MTRMVQATLAETPPPARPCSGGLYKTAERAKEGFGADCGSDWQEPTAFSCTWVTGGWQCTGPGSVTGNPIADVDAPSGNEPDGVNQEPENGEGAVASVPKALGRFLSLTVNQIDPETQRLPWTAKPERTSEIWRFRIDSGGNVESEIIFRSKGVPAANLSGREGDVWLVIGYEGDIANGIDDDIDGDIDGDEIQLLRLSTRPAPVERGVDRQS